MWRWDQQEPFGVNPADENPSGLGAFDLPLRLPGQYFDKETNLHYNMARDYWPDGGRYIQSDPIGLGGGLNTYVYAFATPLRWVDPDGLKVERCCRKTIITLNTIPHCWIKTDTAQAGMNDSPQCSAAGAGYGTSGSGGASGYPGIPVYVSDHSCDQAESCEEFPDVDEDCVNSHLQIGTSLGRFIPPFNSCQSFVYEVFEKCSRSQFGKPYLGYPNVVPRRYRR